MTTPLYVINLPACENRRQRMEDRLRPFREAFDIRFFPAVDGRALSAEARARAHDEARTRVTLDRLLTPGEIGCALSHRAVYQDLLAAGHPCAVVLEDDVDIEADFPEVFRCAQSWLLAARPRVVLFTRAAKYSGWGRALTSGRRFHPAWSAACASGYAFNAAAAVTLEAYQTPIHTVADCWTDVLRDGVAAIRCVVPYCIAPAGGSRADSALAGAREVQWEQKAQRKRDRPRWANWRRHLCRARWRELVKPFLCIRRQPERPAETRPAAH